MAEQNAAEWRTVNEHFAWTPLTIPRAPDTIPEGAERDLYEPALRVFVVRVKSDSDTGRQVRHDPLGFLRANVPEVEVPDRLRLTLVRLNAEIPANPVHHIMVFALVEKTDIAAALEYKEPPEGRAR